MFPQRENTNQKKEKDLCQAPPSAPAQDAPAYKKAPSHLEGVSIEGVT